MFPRDLHVPFTRTAPHSPICLPSFFRASSSSCLSLAKEAYLSLLSLLLVYTAPTTRPPLFFFEAYGIHVRTHLSRRQVHIFSLNTTTTFIMARGAVIAAIAAFLLLALTATASASSSSKSDPCRNAVCDTAPTPITCNCNYVQELYIPKSSCCPQFRVSAHKRYCD